MPFLSKRVLTLTLLGILLQPAWSQDDQLHIEQQRSIQQALKEDQAERAAIDAKVKRALAVQRSWKVRAWGAFNALNHGAAPVQPPAAVREGELRRYYARLADEHLGTKLAAITGAQIIPGPSPDPERMPPQMISAPPFIPPVAGPVILSRVPGGYMFQIPGAPPQLYLFAP